MNNNPRLSKIRLQFFEKEYEYHTSNSNDALKSLINIYLDIFNDNLLFGEHDIYDTLHLILEKNANNEIMEYLININQTSDNLSIKEETAKLIKFIKHLL